MIYLYQTVISLYLKIEKQYDWLVLLSMIDFTGHALFQRNARKIIPDKSINCLGNTKEGEIKSLESLLKEERLLNVFKTF